MFKRAKTKTWAAGLIFALSGLLAGGALAAGIKDTKHNLSTSHSVAGQTIYGDQSEICIFCHTPHAALKNDNIPLWNKELSQVGSYGMYTSPTFNGSTTVADVGIGSDLTKATATNLCLSCHDGTVAINSFNNPSNLEALPVMTGTTLGKLPAASTTNLGNDLKNDHPVNFTYDAALVTADTTSNGGVAGLTAPGSLAGVKLYDSKVQCASCHDPHTSAQGAFLRVTMTGSALCFACHTK